MIEEMLAVAESAVAAGLAPDIARLGRDAVITKVEGILEEYRKLPILDDRSADGIIGYDEHGLPR